MSENITKVPKIRFPGFTDAWEQRKLGKLVDIVRSYSLSRDVETDENSGFRYVHYGDIHKKVAGLIESDEQLPRIKAGDYDLLQKGDVIVADASEDYIGIAEPAVLLNTPRDKVVAGLHTIAMRPKEITPLYLYYLLHTDDFKKFGGKVGTGMKVFGITTKNLFEYPALLPIKEEQELIGDFFHEFDNLITLHLRKLNHLQDEKKSLLQKMFPKNGADVPEIRFPGFTDAWEQRKLGDVVDVNSGRDYKHLSDGNIPVYGTGGYMLSVNEALSYVKDAIGIGRKGTIDKPYLLRAPFWTVDTLFYAIPKEKHDLDFVHSVFQRVNWKQKDESTGVPSLSKSTINAVNVAVPECDEQSQIGHFFNQLDQLITLHQRKLNHLQEQKKSLLQQMFV